MRLTLFKLFLHPRAYQGVVFLVTMASLACAVEATPTPTPTVQATPTPTASPSPSPMPTVELTPTPQLSGGVLVTFSVSGEQFSVFVTNGDTIEQLFALQAGESAAAIPNGPMVEGSGVADHNEPWSWYLDPESIEMAEVTMELCDGRPSYVEANLESWMDSVGRYCPWGAELVSLEDYR